ARARLAYPRESCRCAGRRSRAPAPAPTARGPVRSSSATASPYAARQAGRTSAVGALRRSRDGVGRGTRTRGAGTAAGVVAKVGHGAGPIDQHPCWTRRRRVARTLTACGNDCCIFPLLARSNDRYGVSDQHLLVNGRRRAAKVERGLAEPAEPQ